MVWIALSSPFYAFKMVSTEIRRIMARLCFALFSSKSLISFNALVLAACIVLRTTWNRSPICWSVQSRKYARRMICRLRPERLCNACASASFSMAMDCSKSSKKYFPLNWLGRYESAPANDHPPILKTRPRFFHAVAWLDTSPLHNFSKRFCRSYRMFPRCGEYLPPSTA